MIKLALSGAGGRMGQRLLALSAADPEFELVQAIEWSGFPLMGQNVAAGNANTGGVLWTDALGAGADVLVDFSSPENAVKNARLASGFGTALVVGTTGLSEDEENALRAASASIPVMLSPNYSFGVNLLFKLAEEAAKALGGSYNVEIVEAHHNQKVDAPSGTALGIAHAVESALGRGRDMDGDLVFGRSGKPGKRGPHEIGMHSLRMGALAGDHTVYFCNNHECLSISHRAESRDVLATGALRAAKWLLEKKPGFYSMRDMLF
ncbi:MAG: 4-hydroxy-tetrahydrodipicolinate reductase [Planctomycetota bacterium]|jgi:4-hydroxy-tetrahydrodipicolinate reductase|nr:4-hydroxy-tetrahydrodipicolinate reductase [Planctomycetota bacterium]